MSIHKYYKISDDGQLIRLNQFCPRCGPGFFMANNYDRLTCGHCGYTEFQKKVPKKPKGSDENKEQVIEKKPLTEPEPKKGRKMKKK